MLLRQGQVAMVAATAAVSAPFRRCVWSFFLFLYLLSHYCTISYCCCCPPPLLLFLLTIIIIMTVKKQQLFFIAAPSLQCASPPRRRRRTFFGQKQKKEKSWLGPVVRYVPVQRKFLQPVEGMDRHGSAS